MLRRATRRLTAPERDLARRVLTVIPRLRALCAPTLRRRRVSMERLLVLRALEREPRRGGEIAELWALTPGAVSLLVDALAADGFVARREDARDRRAVLLELTGAGRRELRAAEQAAVAAIAEGIGAVGPAAMARFAAALGELERALAKRSGP